MRDGITGAFRRVARDVLPGMLAAGLLTLAAYRLHFPYAAAGFLYLLVVVLQSLSGNLLASAIVSIFAVGCLDYFFVPPALTWRIADPRDALALAACLLTALVITHLAARAHAQTLAAQRHRKELELLFRAAWQLLAVEPEAAGASCVRFFRDLFDFQAVCMMDAATAEVWLAGLPSAGLVERTRDAYLQDRDVDDNRSRMRLRSLRVAGRTIGAIGFEAGACSPAVVGALSVLGSSTLERVHAFEASIKIAADARAESLRSAILDAFAHEFKTPLTAMLAAAGGLDDADALNSRQLEWVQRIESEASRLGQLVTRLLRVARLDREEVKPRLKATDLGALVTEVVNRQAANFAGRTVSLAPVSEPVMVEADPELLTLALIPLLDHALRYSRPGSTVVVAVGTDGPFAIVHVKNEGNSIVPGEERRMFERFYQRADAGKATPGTGLGLYIARKIVAAHRGSLDLDIEPGETKSATFRMRLPIPASEPGEAGRAS